MKGIMRGPLVLAAIVVVARVLAERLGAPPAVSNLFSVVMLYLLIVPLYFAVRVGGSEELRPYRTQLKLTALYAALARAMVIPTYWLAYIFQWPEGRFQSNQGGVVGPDVSTLQAFVLIPLVAGIAWVIGSVVIGGGLGCAVVALRRRLR